MTITPVFWDALGGGLALCLGCVGVGIFCALTGPFVYGQPNAGPPTFYIQSEGGEPRSVITTSKTWTTAEGVTFRVSDDGKVVIKVEEKE